VKFGIVDGKEKCSFKGCKKILSCVLVNETSHLSRHIDACKKHAKYHNIVK